jgi:hypothetical protein
LPGRSVQFPAASERSYTYYPGGFAMRSCHRFGLLLLGFCFLGMTSCIDSENPLSDPESAKPVKELLGVWRANQDGGTRYYHVGRADKHFPNGILQMKIIDYDKDGVLKVDGSNFFVFSTTLGDRHFVNITALEPEQLAEVDKTGWKPSMFKGYWIYEYHLDGDKIRLFATDWNQKKALIESKKFQGVVKTDQISFKESSETLAKLITSPEGTKLFNSGGEEAVRIAK